MMGRVLLAGLLAALAGCGGGASQDSPADLEQESFGRFEGDVVGVWDANGRDMTLREDFCYIDARQKEWKAPKDSVVNGATIPRVFWSVIGGPFEGRYRNASVVHDVACVEMTEPWQDVHRMFYEACRCGGVGEEKAKVIYWAVHNFGPRWKVVEPKVTSDGTVVKMSQPITPPAPPANIVAVVEEYFEANNPTITEIETLTVEEIREAVEEARAENGEAAVEENESMEEPAAVEESPGESQESAAAESESAGPSPPEEPIAEPSNESADMPPAAPTQPIE